MSFAHHARLIWIMIICMAMFSCSSAPESPRQDASEIRKQWKKSAEIASLKASKSYDILHKKLQSHYNSHKTAGNRLGELYGALDLGDFYTYGLINYTKALYYYNLSKTMNAEVEGLVTHGNEYYFDGKSVDFFITEGSHTYRRDYDYQRIQKHIAKKMRWIVKILESNLGGAATVFDPDRKEEFLKFGFSRAGDLVNAIRGIDERLPPELFNEFRTKLLREAGNYFKRQPSLEPEEKDFFLHYTIARTLVKSFDVTVLPDQQIKDINNHISAALRSDLTEKNPWPQAYLYYIKTVCAARLLSYDTSIQAYGHMQGLVEKINQIMQDEENAKQYITNMAMAKGAFGVAAMVASAFIGGGYGYGSDMASNVGINVLASGFNDAMLIRRKYAFVGESEYSRNLNVLLNMDEQLLLFDALGAAFHRNGNKEKSVFFNREAINIINHMRSTIATEKHRITFARQKDRIFNRLIDDLVAENEISEAFRYSENARSRAFIDLLASKPGIRYKNSQIQNYISNARANQLYYDQLRKQINISESQALYLNNQTRGLQIASDGDSNENRVQDEASQSDYGINDMDEISSLVTVQNVTIDEIRNLLPKNYQLIEFYISENTVYTWIVDRNHQLLLRLNTPGSKITERCLALRQMIRSPDNTNIESEAVISLARALYADLFKPLRPHLAGNKVFIVPHRSLHFLPFDVLHDGKQFLVERFSFSYLPTAAALRFLKNKNSRLQSALVFGNPATDDAITLPPLEWAEKEALEISRYFTPYKLLTRADATKTRFLTLANKFDVVHFACHASMDPSKPMNSKLYLAKDSSQNGYLTLADLYAVKMNAALVVLSACETGLAQLETGDELIGLVRGFFFAGTRSIVASLWRVNDEATMMLMLSFYKNIKTKIPPSEALRNAKIDLLKSNRHTHPFFWSSFNFYGVDL